MFDKKILLITGGTGSFGNAVLDRFLDSSIKEIRIFSRDEKKQDDMRKKYKNPNDIAPHTVSVSRCRKSVFHFFDYRHAAHGTFHFFHTFFTLQSDRTETSSLLQS